jgi:hypothetical protein
MRTSLYIPFALALAFSLVACSARNTDAIVDSPFSFEIKKNMMDDYSAIGTVLSTKDAYPLWKENIQDCAFCMIRTIEYPDLTVRVFSFDVAATGTAEYVAHGPSIRLRNGLAVGNSRSEVLRAMGHPWKVEGSSLVWRSRAGNFLVFSFSGDTVSAIRWHESREAKYKDVRVWETRH